MNAKHKAELIRIKAEMKEVEEMVNEVSEEEMPKEEVVAEVPAEMKEEVVAVEEAPVEEIVEEVLNVKLSERATRLIDGENEVSMERKKMEGYF